jgi:DNA-3-methyladenine glycosylase II
VPLVGLTPLDEATVAVASRELARRDRALAAAFERNGPPPLWTRPPGFATLLQIVLEQQVSLASARAAYDRLLLAADPLTPATFLELDGPALLAIGFSRQKARYGRALAEALEAGSLDLDAVAALSDDEAMAALTALPGIGPWTASIYLLMALRRPDLWPAGDVALQSAAAEVLALPARPTPDELTTLAEPWRPWRSVAARMLWHDYLRRRGRA